MEACLGVWCHNRHASRILLGSTISWRSLWFSQVPVGLSPIRKLPRSCPSANQLQALRLEVGFGATVSRIIPPCFQVARPTHWASFRRDFLHTNRCLHEAHSHILAAHHRRRRAQRVVEAIPCRCSHQLPALFEGNRNRASAGQGKGQAFHLDGQAVSLGCLR